ncbi:FxSxx-COOH system tetratricopeptide repeat protein [Dactylosporangium sp. NPDC049140]|uniref:FxSxx-COOH system tetratricopeptide repeat protein n=1 Tax=Dactylosporangium sp. NPDC049140 TaxID=3155647 RepID=UPI0033C44336
MSQAHGGRIVTFYSFAGGVGVTMALANVAWILAANGRRVLAVDWDVDSPGLHRYFDHFLADPGLRDPARTGGNDGVSELIRRVEAGGRYEAPRPQRLDWGHFPAGGVIDYLPAGRHNPAYTSSLGAMDWDGFYHYRGGGRFFDRLRQDMTAEYDFTLIDSPSGLGEMAQVCISHLPDVVLNCFTLGGKSIEGAVRARRGLRSTDRPGRILPVPMRVDPAERDRAEAGLRAARTRMPDLPTGMSDRERDAYWAAVEVPYDHAYAYEESLAVLTEEPGRRGSVLAAYERIAYQLGDPGVRGLPPADDAVRRRAAGRFARTPDGPDRRIMVHYEPRDQAWADWVIAILGAAGLGVQDAGERAAAPGGGRELRIISAGRAAEMAARRPVDPAAHRPPLGVYVDDSPVLAAFPDPPAVRLHGLTEADAADRLLRLATGAGGGRASTGLRYPGTPPAASRLPAHRPGFTGRETDLRSLRRRLLRAGQAGPHQIKPVVLYGLSGVGKTALAAEYVRRFAGTYDLVWWLDCDEPDEGIAELAAALGRAPGTVAPETAKALVEEGTPFRRWLLVLDGAEGYPQIEAFLPPHGGHVVITSRNHSWPGGVLRMQVGSFDPKDSALYLRRQVPGLDGPGADQIAHALGDLPLALATASAQLSASGESAAQYLGRLEDGDLGMPELVAAWEPTLRRLEERSPAAYRLLQLFSVLHSDTARDLVYSKAMAEVLRPFVKAPADLRAEVAVLVAQIISLGLLELDVERIHMHPLLQRVVRERTPPPERAEIRHAAHLVLAALARGRDIDDHRDWPQLDLIWSHLAVARAAVCRDESVRALVIDHIRRLQHGGALARAAQLAARTEAAWAAEPDGPDWQVLHLRGVHATVLREQGHFAAARRIDEQVAAAQADLLGAEHPNTLTSHDRLVADLLGLGRYEEAVGLARRAYRCWSRTVGSEHARTLDALTELATAYRAAGRYRAARRCDERVARRRPFPAADPHPAVLRSAAGLGRDLRDAREFEASVELLRAVAEASGTILGPGAPATVAAQANLAVSLHSAGRPEEAVLLLGDAALKMARLVGKAAPVALACRHSWGLSLLATGRAPRARTELEQVVELYGTGLGPAHPLTLIAQANLAAAAWATGDRDAAPAAAAAAAALAASVPTEHPLARAVTANAAALRGGAPAFLPPTVDPY